MSTTCPRCGVEVKPPGFASDTPLHTNAQCADRLAARVAELEAVIAEALDVDRQKTKEWNLMNAACLKLEEQVKVAREALKAVVDAGHENGNYCDTEIGTADGFPEHECDCIHAIAAKALAALGEKP